MPALRGMKISQPSSLVPRTRSSHAPCRKDGCELRNRDTSASSAAIAQEMGKAGGNCEPMIGIGCGNVRARLQVGNPPSRKLVARDVEENWGVGHGRVARVAGGGGSRGGSGSAAAAAKS